MTGSVVYLRGNAAELPLADNTVDLIVTSPPYFALRSYQDGGEHYDGQLGAEPTPGEFIDALITCTAEMKRVLKPSGSIFVNLGDKYAGSAGSSGYSAKSTLAGYTSETTKGREMNAIPPRRISSDVPAKSLMGIPWRYALRCIDDLGLILRAEIIWAKPNGLPESVRDRVARKHEQWFHFTKSPRYYTGIDEIREPHKGTESPNARRGPSGPNRGTVTGRTHDDHAPVGNFTHAALGKLPGSVWTIATEPLVIPDDLGVDHYAAFPTEWPRRLITAFAPTGICTACDDPRVPVVERKTTGRDNNYKQESRVGRVNRKAWETVKSANPDRIVGYACACPDTTAPTTPAVVLDPFGGTGTTAAVAKALGRIGITNDLSADYLRLAKWRCDGDGYQKILKKLGRKPRTPKAPPAPDNVIPLELFDTPGTAAS